jgi:hypothetical protein
MKPQWSCRKINDSPLKGIEDCHAICCQYDGKVYFRLVPSYLFADAQAIMHVATMIMFDIGLPVMGRHTRRTYKAITGV